MQLVLSVDKHQRKAITNPNAYARYELAPSQLAITSNLKKKFPSHAVKPRNSSTLSITPNCLVRVKHVRYFCSWQSTVRGTACRIKFTTKSFISNRFTQVSYDQIKAETGWTKPAAFLRRRRVIVKDPAIDIATSGSSWEKSVSLDQPPAGHGNQQESGKAPSGDSSAQVQKRINVKTSQSNNDAKNRMTSQKNGANNVTSQRSNMTSQNNVRVISQSNQPSPEIREEKVKSPITVYIYPEARRNSSPVTPEQSPMHYLAQPHRQSTVETVDSGIADDHNGGGSSPQILVSNSPRLSLDSRMLPTRPQPRFRDGHRVVTR